MDEKYLDPYKIGIKGKLQHQRFWDLVNTSDDINSCWEWKGSRSGRYGKFKISGDGISTNIHAHRYSYYLLNHYYPDSAEYVCHKCDNTFCVNPYHLFLGTQFDNMRDMVAKGRNTDNTGDKNPNCKLSSEKVAQMRKLHQEGLSGNKLSVMFSISRTQTSRILNGESWGIDGSH